MYSLGVLQHMNCERDYKLGRIFITCCLLTFLVLPGARFAHADSLKCLRCHSAPGLLKTTEGRYVSLHVNRDELTSSAHALRDCLDCHTDFRGQPFPHKRKADPVNCIRCHHKGNAVGAPDSLHVEGYTESVHGEALKRGNADAPRCANCHGTHGIRGPSDPKSSVYRTNIPVMCGKCHLDEALVERHGLPDVTEYANSVHAGISHKDGPGLAAVCTDCHGVHDIQPAISPTSGTNKVRVPATCGKCHAKIQELYEKSIHGSALAQGVEDAPACSDCHGEHGIRSISTAASSVNPAHVVTTCSKCHENVRIQRRYGLPAHRLATYMASYHGVANKFGQITVANCATCHGAHNVLPSSDPQSPVNKANLSKTCGGCHPGAGDNFAKGTVHVFLARDGDAIVYWVRLAYLIFIAGLIGVFCMYIALDLFARWRGRLPWRGGTPDAKP